MNFPRVPLLMLLAFVVLSAAVYADTLNDARKAHGAGQLDTAISLYQQVVQNGPPSEAREAQFAIAACLFSEKVYDGAYNAFLAFSQKYTDGYDSVLATVMAGNVRVEQGRPDDAKPLFDQALTQNESTLDSYLWISWANLGEGRVLTADKDYPNALPYLQKAIRMASEPRVTDIAMQCITQCVTGLKAAGTPDVTATAWLGSANLDHGRWLMDHEEYKQAETVLLDALPDLTGPGMIGEAQLLLGKSCFEQNRIDDAGTHIQQALLGFTKYAGAASTYPKLLGETYRYEARVLMRQKSYGKAIQACETLRTTDPGADIGDVADSYILEASASQIQGNTAQAVALAKDLRAQNYSKKWNTFADLLTGDIYRQSGDYASAIATYRAAITSDGAGIPGYDGALRYHLAGSLAASKDTAGAKAALEDIITNVKDSQWVARARQRLSSLGQ